jgi:hypothetical protein
MRRRDGKSNRHWCDARDRLDLKRARMRHRGRGESTSTCGQAGFRDWHLVRDTADRIREFVKFTKGKTQVDDQDYWYLSQIKKP